MRMLVSETPFHPTLPTADAAGFRCSWTHWNLPRQIVLPYLYLAIMMLLRSLILLNQNNHEWNTCPHARALASSPASTLISLLPPEIAAAWCKWPRKKKKKGSVGGWGAGGQPSSKSEVRKAFWFQDEIQACCILLSGCLLLSLKRTSSKEFIQGRKMEQSTALNSYCLSCYFPFLLKI